MKYTYDFTDINSYLDFELEYGDEPDLMVYGMLAQNKIDSLFPVFYKEEHDRKFYHYDITNLTTLSELLTYGLTKEQVYLLLSNICKAMIDIEAYMLPVESFIWDTNYMYVSTNNMELKLLNYGVCISEDYKIDLMQFMRILWGRIQMTENNYKFVNTVQQYLSENYSFVAKDFMQVLDYANKDVEQVIELTPEKKKKALFNRKDKQHTKNNRKAEIERDMKLAKEKKNEVCNQHIAIPGESDVLRLEHLYVREA